MLFSETITGGCAEEIAAHLMEESSQFAKAEKTRRITL
jgi:hypothetical protein